MSVESTNKDLIQVPRFAFGNYEHIEMKAEAMGFCEMTLEERLEKGKDCTFKRKPEGRGLYPRL